MSIFDEKIYYNLELLAMILEYEDFRKCFLNMKKYPWIPGKNGINVKNDYKFCEGSSLELISPLGKIKINFKIINTFILNLL